MHDIVTGERVTLGVQDLHHLLHGTPPVNSENRNRKLSDNNSSDGGSKKSVIGGGGVAEIFISILVVGAVVAFFIVKRRSKKSVADIEKADSQPFTSYASQKVQGTNLLHSIEKFITFSLNRSHHPFQKLFSEHHKPANNTLEIYGINKSK
ncbi:hypothetical protein AgCh_024256 [Apium graveolens]